MVRILALLAFAGCTPSHEDNPVAAPSSQPVTPTPSASASAATTADPQPTASPAVPLDGEWSPALLTRLAQAADALPAGKLVSTPPPDSERDRAITKTFGQRCRLERTCGPLWGIDCEAAVDGPYYYARPRADRVERITVCGGACMGGRCTNCPPRAQGWTCATY